MQVSNENVMSPAGERSSCRVHLELRFLVRVPDDRDFRFSGTDELIPNLSVKDVMLKCQWLASGVIVWINYAFKWPIGHRMKINIVRSASFRTPTFPLFLRQACSLARDTFHCIVLLYIRKLVCPIVRLSVRPSGSALNGLHAA